MNNKGISEIISQILLLLITVIVIGIIIGALVPQITRSQSRLNFEESKRVRDNIYSNIQEVYNSPIGYTKEVKLSLENLTLVIDADTNTIEVYSLIDGDFYKDGLRQDETSEKYTYRKGQKVYAGFTLSNINLARSYVLENVTRTSIYLRKTDKEKITVLLENITEDSWFTSSNLGLYTENPSTWQYRKKILLDGNKVDGNLTNFPVLIYLEDPDLRDYANADGNDIMFTLGDGKTKLKREIEDYNSDTGILYAWVKIPELTTETDTPIYVYFGNPSANEHNDKDVWDEDFAVVHHFNNNFLDSTINNINGVVTGTITPVADRFNTLNAFSFASGHVTIPKPFNQNKLEQVWTVDAWYKLETKNSTQTLLGGYNLGCHFIWGSTQKPLLYLNGGSVHDYYNYGNGNSIYTDIWQKITFVFRNSDAHRKIYINGIDITTVGPNKTSTPFGISSTINIGDSYSGDLDELRISTILRSESWIKTEYTNQANPEEFIKTGILEKA